MRENLFKGERVWERGGGAIRRERRAGGFLGALFEALNMEFHVNGLTWKSMLRILLETHNMESPC